MESWIQYTGKRCARSLEEGGVRMRRRWKKTAALSLVFALAAAGTAMAGEWKQDEKGWWWQFEDGTYLKSRSAFLDGNQDGSAERYFFGDDGYLLVSTTTEDGRTVNADGQQLLADGSVLSVQVATPHATTQDGTVGGYYLGDIGGDWTGDAIPKNPYTIYYGIAVQVIDDNTISVKPDQFDNMQPVIFHKVSDGVYEVPCSSGGVDRYTFSGGTVTFTCPSYEEIKIFKK